ncbi:MAG TPA: phage holin family protein [Clostridiaceae bacterium]|nr:phage holin family protein [Clostridiaceae bacterium]
MNQTTGTKSFMFFVTAVLGYLYNSINELVVILILFMIMDYILGIIEVFKTKKQFDKEVALWGIIKKVLYGFVLAIAFLVDFIIIFLTTKIGMKLPVSSMFGIAAIAYLLGTEGFSIVKHFLIIGVPAPNFLLKFFGLLKDESGKIIPFSKEEREETEDEEEFF